MSILAGLTLPASASKFAAKYGIYVAVAVLMAAILALAYCTGSRSAEVEAANDRLEANNEFLEDKGKADENAGEARTESAVTIEQQRKELANAVNSDEDPSTLRQRRGCLILRQQRAGPTGLPACSRFETGS